MLSELREALQWAMSRHAWKLILTVCGAASLVVLIGYWAIKKDAFVQTATCRLSENGSIVAIFYLSAGLAISVMILIGEMINLVDARREGRPMPGRGHLYAASIAVPLFTASIMWVMHHC